MPSFESWGAAASGQFHVVKTGKGGNNAVEFAYAVKFKNHFAGSAEAFFNQFSQVKLMENCGGKQKTPQKAGLVPRTGFEPVIPP